MAGTTLTSLAGRIAAESAIQAATAAITPIKNFARSFKEAEAQKGASIRVPIFDGAPAKDFDKATANYAGTDKDVYGVDVLINQHLVKPVEYDDIDFVECPVDFWQGAGVTIGDAIGRGAVARTMALVNKTAIPKTGEGFSAANEVVFANPNKAKFAQLRAACAAVGIKPGETTALLDPVYFATMLAELDSSIYGGAEAIRNGSIPALFGFKAITECGELTTDEGENLVGALVPTNAIAIAGRYLKPQSKYDEAGTATDESTGLTIGFRRFGDLKTGENYLAGEILFGAKLIQPTKIVRLVSAATA